MAKVSKMPGCRCQFYINGKCLYEEMLNPGYNNDWRCRIIKELEKEYDRLLHQAEAFKLDEKTFSDLWEQRMEEHLKSTVVCRKMIPHEDDEFPPCAAAYDDICTLELDDCEGVCARFKPCED